MIARLLTVIVEYERHFRHVIDCSYNRLSPQYFEIYLLVNSVVTIVIPITM